MRTCKAESSATGESLLPEKGMPQACWEHAPMLMDLNVDNVHENTVLLNLIKNVKMIYEIYWWNDLDYSICVWLYFMSCLFN